MRVNVERMRRHQARTTPDVIVIHGTNTMPEAEVRRLLDRWGAAMDLKHQRRGHLALYSDRLVHNGVVTGYWEDRPPPTRR